MLDISQPLIRQNLPPAGAEREWQDQKIQALERLAGGIAHDFNNILAVILLQSEMLERQLAGDIKLKQRVSEIRSVSNDAAAVVKQLLSFARKRTVKPESVDLNKEVADFIEGLGPLSSSKIEITVETGPKLKQCRVDRAQLRESLDLLARNAAEALPDGGAISFVTRNVTITAEDGPSPQQAGEYVELSVSDDGIGMTPETLVHIFEPFFSTRGSDKAAGLGLATVYGIVKQSGGFVWANSSVGVGTTFRLHFPAAPAAKLDGGP